MKVNCVGHVEINMSIPPDQQLMIVHYISWNVYHDDCIQGQLFKNVSEQKMMAQEVLPSCFLK